MNGPGWFGQRGISRFADPADEYEVVYATDKAEFRRVDGQIETRLEIAVTPEHRAEVRRLVVTNHDTREHVVELTSYLEIVLAAHAADRCTRPLVSCFWRRNLYRQRKALLCRRRPRERTRSRSGPCMWWLMTARL